MSDLLIDHTELPQSTPTAESKTLGSPETNHSPDLVKAEPKPEIASSNEVEKPLNSDPPSQAPDEPMKDQVHSEDQASESSEPSQEDDPICTKSYRAKLYRLTEDGGWDDLGTGYSKIVRLSITSQDEDQCIVLIAEDDKRTQLLKSKIIENTNYHRQRGNPLPLLNRDNHHMA